MQSKIIKKVKSFLSYSLKLFILTSFLLSQSFIAEIFLYQNNPNTKSINTAKADYNDHWYNTSWSYRKPITIHSSQVSHTTEASQSNFPVLVSFIDPNLKTTSHSGKVQNDPNGYDIIFVGQDGTTQTQLDHEIEKYDPTTGEIVAWVKIPVLSSVADTTLYVYYGNNAINATQEHKTAVWNDGTGNHFKGVWHLGDTPSGHAVGDYKDSTINATNSTNTSLEPIATTGKVGGAQNFDGTSYVNLGNGANLKFGTTNFTMEVWFKTTYSGYQIILGNSPQVGKGYVLGIHPNNDIYLFLRDGTTDKNVLQGNAVNDGSWHQAVATINRTSSVETVYVDGVALPATDISVLGDITSLYNLYIGKTVNEPNFHGSLDEVRISDTARSADWIKTEYNNESNPSTFYVLGAEEEAPPVLAEVTSVPTPANNTPPYTFSSTKAGTIVYGGDCSSVTTSAIVGNNTILFNALSVGTHSNCTIQVTDGLENHSSLLAITTFTIPALWYNVSWQYRKQAVINHNQVPNTDQSNFPVLVSVTNNSLKTVANGGRVASSNGYDIIFVSQDDTSQLNHEIESYNGTTGTIVMWVKVPTISHTTDTTIYIYFGNSNVSTSQENKAAVWDSDFQGVWHLKEPGVGAIGDYKDSTVNSNNSINNTTANEPAQTTGKVGGAQSFNGSSQYVDLGNGANLKFGTTDFTMEVWFKTTYSGYQILVGNGPQTGKGYSFGIHASNQIYMALQDGTNSRIVLQGSAVNNDTWHQAVVTINKNALVATVYVDSNVLSATDISVLGDITSLYNLYIGKTTNEPSFNGAIDEVRISDTARSADWIKTEYNNQSNPSTFYVLGAEENLAGMDILPVLAEISSVPAITIDTTPSYTFSSTKAGIITYSGDCSSAVTSANSGDNAITFNALSAGTHSNCAIRVTDGQGNQSNTLLVTSFTINTAITTYVVPAITDNKILPKSYIYSSYASDTVSARVSSGEYKAASFVINSNVNINGLQVEASNLTGNGNGNAIPNTSVDIKTVKCWYQGGNETDIEVHGRYLTPELLLKDDSLVNVDGDYWSQWNVPNSNGKNYLKLTDGSYIDISSDTPERTGYDIISISERPVQDATTLQPVSLPANYNKQFWVTLHVPNNTPAGNYSGTISLKNGTQTIKSLNVNIQVLPINLPQSNIEYSVYYRGTINGNGSISSEDKTVQQYTAEQQDMRAHGITNPTIYSPVTDSTLLQELSIRQQAGIDNTNMYYIGGISTNNIPYYKNLTAPYGVTNLYNYGPDEGPIDRDQINNEHNAGGKHFNAEYTFSYANSAADILDLLVMAGSLSPTLAAKYHSYGNKIYSYYNPQIVPEYPRIFRMNYGLALWQADYDGTMDYAYQHSFGDIWNDFDYFNGRYAYRDHAFAYPTMNGVIDTIQWEGFREGVNDMRYLAALQDAIATAKSQGEDTTVVIEAESYLANLKNSDLTSQDLDVIRSQMIDYILALASSTHSLTVNHGTGSGFHARDSQITVTSDTPQAGMVFDKWIGDTSFVSDVNAAVTIVTMPSHAISLTAVYTSPWHDSGSSYRKAIIINHNQVSNIDQNNFPVLISTIDASLKNIASGGKVADLNGYDIIFTLPNGTLLNHEVESYDNTTGKLVAWVKIPVLSHTTDTTFYIYYGDTSIATSQENKTAVWNEGGQNHYKAVWHLGETGTGATGDYKDSTQYANNSINNATTNEPIQTTGQIGGAQSFNGSSQFINLGNGANLKFGTTDFTLEVWFKTTYSGYQILIGNGPQTGKGYSFGTHPNNQIYMVLQDGTNDRIVLQGSAVNNDTWHQAVATIDRNSSAMTVYVDSKVLPATDISALGDITSLYSLYIGKTTNEPSFNGSLDEVRISDTARSADWIKTEYNNESSPNTFSTFSSEENLLPPTITSLSANLPTGTYGTGTTIPITINFSKDVTSTGNITLTLNTTLERFCSFTVTNNNTATCNYTIQGGDSATNLNATISGTIHDQFNNLLTNFTPLSNLSDNTIININTSSSPFTPPTKPNITTIQSAANSGINIDLQSIPSNITQIAISLTPDFKGVSWIDFDRKKFSTINQTTQTLYIKFRTNEGAVSDTIIITPQTSINNTISLIDGDIIQCKSSNDPNAVYIVKITGTKTYIRHITSIRIFNYYKHLKWENLKQVDSLTPFSLSGWIRVNTGTNGLPKAEDKVYEINGDQTKHWINMTAQQFLSHGGSDEAIYTVNTGELNLYSAGADVVSL